MSEDIKTDTTDVVQKPKALPPDPVRLVSSARFYVETVHTPPGIPSRDLPGFLEGEVEELSLFPLESTSWGYLENSRSKSEGTVLLYAAFREHINGATDPSFTKRFAVLPGFTALAGRSWRKPTWVVLLERECLSVVRMVPGANVPDRVFSRYGNHLEENPEAAWALRDELFEASEIRSEEERIEEGMLRVSRSTVDRRGEVVFLLERQRSAAEGWKRYGVGRIKNEQTLLAADVRDSHFLSEERGRRRAVRQLRLFLKIAVFVLIALGVFQYAYLKRLAETTALTDQVKAQQPAVQTLKDQESRVKTASRLSDAPLKIFDWLSVVNELRPETVYFTMAYADREATLGFSGEAPSVAIVNQYRDALEESARIEGVEIRDMASAKKGVKFTLQVKVGPADEESSAATETETEI